MRPEIERIRSIRSFPSLVKYLREELNWKIDDADIDDLTFEYEAEELGLDKETAVKVKEIKQLRPLVSNQPWGIFYLSFEKKRLPIVALRRILRSLVLKKRESANRSGMATWNLNDLLFISSYGEEGDRDITFAHFSDNSGMGDLPTLKVLGWNSGNTVLRLEDTYKTLTEKLSWVDDETDVEAWRKQWSEAFKLGYRETVRTSRELAVRLADLAKVIRESANAVLEIESEKGELRKLFKAFQEALIQDLTEDDFADMYAQTIAYGLLSARISRSSGALVAENVSDLIPNTNPFLKELMQTFMTVGGRKSKIDFDELGINEVVELLRNANIEEVLRDFGAKNPNEDPVIHFYELFLKEYDPDKRMKRGVFYTPRPVVSFIVRSVHEILQKEFGLADGLADTTTWREMRSRNPDLEIPEGVNETAPFVQILDPATGTGTFLVEVIEQIHKTLEAKWQREGKSRAAKIEAWNEYVPKNLLPRLYGFELMMAPYSIAHMKIGLKLSETGYRFLSSERAQIYLTNTLEEPKDFSDYFATMSPALAHEAEAANRVKRQAPITVVVGNPPYSIASENQSSWIIDLCETYKATVRGNERQIQALSDDYVKFFRYSEWLMEKANCGVLGLITNNGFLDGHLFVDMRNSLTSTFDELFLANLRGNSRTSERPPEGGTDENVFDIQTGVVASVFTKLPQALRDHVVRYMDFWGNREQKYLSLSCATAIEGNKIYVATDQSLFLPVDLTLKPEWDSYIGLTGIFGTGNARNDAQKAYAAGFVTQQDKFAISFSSEEACSRLQELLAEDMTESELRSRYKLCTTNQWNFGNARAELSRSPQSATPTECLYRPFDDRWTIFHRGVVTILRREIMRHMRVGDNFALLATRGISRQVYAHTFVSNKITDRHAIDNASESMFVFPLFRYEGTTDLLRHATTPDVVRVSNIASSFIGQVGERLQLDFDDDETCVRNRSFNSMDVFHYAYAVFHSPTYRSRYAEFLKIDFPRLPLTTDRELFRKLCALGAKLVALHLLDGVDAPDGWNLIADSSTLYQNTEVAPGHPKYEDGKVYINKTSYFSGVPEEVWNFHVGGYQVCHKWLKDRKGRTLSPEDIEHYGKIGVSLSETIRLMAEIDELIEVHGGFPLVGSVESAK